MPRLTILLKIPLNILYCPLPAQIFPRKSEIFPAETLLVHSTANFFQSAFVSFRNKIFHTENNRCDKSDNKFYNERKRRIRAFFQYYSPKFFASSSFNFTSVFIGATFNAFAALSCTSSLNT